MTATNWEWKIPQPKTDRKGVPIPYKLEENGKIKWKCKNCRGIYFQINEDNTLSCFSCKKTMYTGKLPKNFTWTDKKEVKHEPKNKRFMGKDC